MTLIEVTVGMVIIIIVTLIAYMGVSASANFTARGVDLRNADGPAVSEIESKRKDVLNAIKKNDTSDIIPVDPDVISVDINYKVSKISYDYSAEDSSDTAGVNEVVMPKSNTNADNDDYAQLKAVRIEAKVTDNGVDVRYDMYLPEKQSETP